MKQILRYRLQLRLTIDPCSKKDRYPEIPSWVASRHTGRRAKWTYYDGTAVVTITDGWYLHRYKNGLWMISELPF